MLRDQMENLTQQIGDRELLGKDNAGMGSSAQRPRFRDCEEILSVEGDEDTVVSDCISKLSFIRLPDVSRFLSGEAQSNPRS